MARIDPAREGYLQEPNYLRKTITFADSSAVTVGKLKSGSLILKPMSGVHVSTAFNAATTNNLDIGTTVTSDLFATDLSVATATFVACDEAIGGFLLAADATITATYQQTGTAATAGSGEVVICFLPPANG